MILVIDNFDSFTFNLVQALGGLGARPRVVRNNAIAPAEIEAMGPEQILISPGPCTPNEAGISMEVVRRFAGRIPLLGVCLGHQCLGQVFGGRTVRAPVPVHGKTACVQHRRQGVFRDMPEGFRAARYHSLVVEWETLPSCLEVTAWCDGLIMGLRHREHPMLEGVQFHPESFLTTQGDALLKRFLTYRM